VKQPEPTQPPGSILDKDGYSPLEAWQADKISELAHELGATRAVLHEVCTLALAVVSDTTPAGMDSDNERRLRQMCAKLLGAKG